MTNSKVAKMAEAPLREGSKKMGVAHYKCCDSHSCHHQRSLRNGKARKSRASK